MVVCLITEKLTMLGLIELCSIISLLRYSEFLKLCSYYSQGVFIKNYSQVLNIFELLQCSVRFWTGRNYVLLEKKARE